MVAEPQSPAMTVDEYRAFERASTDRHEFFDGYVYAMAGGSRAHSGLGRMIATLLAVALGDESPCEVYNSDMRVRMSEAVLVYPDVTVTCDERDRINTVDDEISYPRLVVEVLSQSTEHRDRGRKLRDYQTCPSVQEYVLVNVDYRAVEVYRRGAESWTYHRFEGDDIAEFASIEVRIPLARIYARITLPLEPEG